MFFGAVIDADQTCLGSTVPKLRCFHSVQCFLRFPFLGRNAQLEVAMEQDDVSYIPQKALSRG